MVTKIFGLILTGLLLSGCAHRQPFSALPQNLPQPTPSPDFVIPEAYVVVSEPADLFETLDQELDQLEGELNQLEVPAEDFQ